MENEVINELKRLVGISDKTFVIKVEKVYPITSPGVAYKFLTLERQGVKSFSPYLSFTVFRPGFVATLFGDTLEKRVYREAKRAVMEKQKEDHEKKELTKLINKLEKIINEAGADDDC